MYPLLWHCLYFHIISWGLMIFVCYKVDYQEKQFAQGIIPHTFMRREGAPKERELLCGRLIDRPIRPLFPAGFFHEVQVEFPFRYLLYPM